MTSPHPFPSHVLRVIHTKGDDYEIGRQHAELIGEPATLGMSKFYYGLWRRMLSEAPAGKIDRWVFNAVKGVLDPLLVGKLLARVPDFMRRRLQGLADGLGKPYTELATALILPDMLPLLQAYLARVKPALFLEASPPRLGCSSFVSDGKHFLYGRNLDFPGVGFWDRYPVIQLIERKGCLRYIGFTTAGAPLAGISGVNEAGISVALHQHYCLETSLKGTLPFVIGEEILASARTLQNALDILRESRVATSWAFIVTDGNRRDAFVYECHPKACGVRFLHDRGKVMAHSNFFQSTECQPREYSTTARMNWDNYWRKQRLEELVTAAGESLEPAQATQFLSEHYDRFWNEEKVTNRTVSQVYNIQSYVLDPEKMMAWMAVGDFPIHLRSYQGVNLGEIFSGRGGETGNQHPAYQFRSENRRAAKEAYILSFVAAFENQYERALTELERVLQLDECPEASQVAGVIHLKLGNYPRAKELLSQARGWIEEKVTAKGLERFPPEYFEATLYLARAHDLLGERSSAVALYEALAAHPTLEDANLRRLALQGGPYSAARLKRVVMPYSSYIPFD